MGHVLLAVLSVVSGDGRLREGRALHLFRRWAVGCSQSPRVLEEIQDVALLLGLCQHFRGRDKGRVGVLSCRAYSQQALQYDTC